MMGLYHPILQYAQYPGPACRLSLMRRSLECRYFPVQRGKRPFLF